MIRRLRQAIRDWATSLLTIEIARGEGLAAQESGLPRSFIPYVYDDPRYAAWNEGYDQGQQAYDMMRGEGIEVIRDADAEARRAILRGGDTGGTAS